LLGRALIGLLLLAVLCLVDPQPTKEVADPLGPPTPVLAWSTRGIASWYGRVGFYGEPAIAWYTRKTKWGNPVIFYGAAGPELRRLLGDKNPYHEHYLVMVRNKKTGKTIIVDVVDWCGCSKGAKREKLIDLSPAAFQALGLPLSRGVQIVTVSQFSAP